MLETSVTAVVVTEVHDHTYFAELHLKSEKRGRVLSLGGADASEGCVAITTRTGRSFFALACTMTLALI